MGATNRSQVKDPEALEKVEKAFLMGIQNASQIARAIQKPIRTVNTYMQIVQRKYRGSFNAEKIREEAADMIAQLNDLYMTHRLDAEAAKKNGDSRAEGFALFQARQVLQTKANALRSLGPQVIVQQNFSQTNNTVSVTPEEFFKKMVQTVGEKHELQLV